MSPWITNFLLLVISSHKLKVCARKARQWACPRLVSVVCVLNEASDGNVISENSIRLTFTICCVDAHDVPPFTWIFGKGLFHSLLVFSWQLWFFVLRNVIFFSTARHQVPDPFLVDVKIGFLCIYLPEIFRVNSTLWGVQPISSYNEILLLLRWIQNLKKKKKVIVDFQKFKVHAVGLLPILDYLLFLG
jgi:hypothetical protein